MAKKKSVPVAIRWDKDDLEIIREACTELGISFSRFLRRAAYEHLQLLAADGVEGLTELATESKTLRRRNGWSV